MQKAALSVGGNWHKTTHEAIRADQARMMTSQVVMDIWRIIIQPQRVIAYILSEEVFGDYLNEFERLISRYNDKNILYIGRGMKIDPDKIDIHKLAIVDATKEHQLRQNYGTQSRERLRI